MAATSAWIDRVRAADAEAEETWKDLEERERYGETNLELALRAIASELRAKRISERPGGITRVQPK